MLGIFIQGRNNYFLLHRKNTRNTSLVNIMSEIVLKKENFGFDASFLFCAEERNLKKKVENYGKRNC